MEMNIAKIAEMCHEMNKLWCELNGDYSQVSFTEAPEWQRKSAEEIVRYYLDNPDAGPSTMHTNWLRDKINNGWKYGPVKDEIKKEHPCCVLNEDLPAFQRTKDEIVFAVINTFR